MKSQYTQDVEFNSGFGSLQTPVHLFTAAILCSYNKVDITGSFRYLDLACGNGHTLTLLADAYPQAEFVNIIKQSLPTFIQKMVPELVRLRILE